MSDKDILRARCLAARGALDEEKRRQKSAQIAAKLAQNGAVLRAKTVLSYLSATDEVDLSAFHTWAIALGKRLAYPISAAGGHMVAAVPEDDEAIVKGRFGIRAPIRERAVIVPPATIDVIIVPCVGFDHRGYRLGHGGGYYDRYLPQCPDTYTILVAFGEQEVSRVPVEVHDIRVDEIITA